MINLLDIQNKKNIKQISISDDEIICNLIACSSEIDNLSTSDIDASFKSYVNLKELMAVKESYPDDALWNTYSTEAWNINERVKAIIERFKVFFKKAFAYIGSFVVFRVKASTAVIKKWEDTLKDPNMDKEKVTTIFEELKDTKTVPVLDIVNCLNSARAAYEKLSDQITKVKAYQGTSSGSEQSAQNKLTEMFADPPELKTFEEQYKIVSDKLPSSESKDESKGEDYVTGKWNDVGSITNLRQACEGVVAVLQNIKRLQVNCDGIVADLMKPSNDETNNIKQINDEKIKFLKSFSKNLLSGMMSAIAKCASLGAKACNTFNGKYNAQPVKK